MTAQPTTAALWHELGGDLKQFIRRRVKDDHTADDLLQETFVRIHRRLDTLQEADRVSAWVYKIARNVITDHFRRHSGDALPVVEEVAERDAGEEELPCGAAHWLEAMVQELPDTYRDAVRLSELEGISHQAVADRLGISLSAAKQRVVRGREQLRHVLDSCCTFERDCRGNVVDYDPKPDRTVCRDCGDRESNSLG